MSVRLTRVHARKVWGEDWKTERMMRRYAVAGNEISWYQVEAPS